MFILTIHFFNAHLRADKFPVDDVIFTGQLPELRRGKQLRCVSCDSQIVQGQHLVVTLDTCFLCHFKGLEHGRHEETLGGCKACHDAPKQKIQLATGLFDHGEYTRRDVGCENCHSDSIKGDGAVPRQACWVCHNQPAQIARYNEPAFIHANHVTKHKVECSSCHVQIEHHLTAGAAFLPELRAAGIRPAGKASAASVRSRRTRGRPSCTSARADGGCPTCPAPCTAPRWIASPATRPAGNRARSPTRWARRS